MIAVPTEREPRLAIMKTRSEAAEYVFKLKNFVESRYKQNILAHIFFMGEPVETIT